MKFKNSFFLITWSMFIVFGRDAYASDSDDDSMTEQEELTLADALIEIDYRPLIALKFHDVKVMDLAVLLKTRKRLNEVINQIEDRKKQHNLTQNSTGTDRTIFQKLGALQNNITIRRDEVGNRINRKSVRITFGKHAKGKFFPKDHQ